MRVDDACEECDAFVTALVEEALAEAERYPDGFTPFGAVLEMDGEELRIREHESTDPEAVIDEIRSALSQEGESARCVAVVWDGYSDLLGTEHDAVNVEVYELGRPNGRLVAMAYEHGPAGVRAIRQIPEQPLTDPIVPLTVELVRRHLDEFDEWVEEGRSDLRRLVQEFDADTYGYDELDEHMRDFDEDPRTAAPLLDEWLSDVLFGELDHDDAVALLAPVARLVGESLVTAYGGRWDLTVDNGQFARIVVLDGDNRLDPYAFIAEYADAPLPPVSHIIRDAENRVHR